MLAHSTAAIHLRHESEFPGGEGEIDLLEPERQVTVTGEESHQETLARHHSTTRSLTRVATELASCSVSRGKHKGAYAVEVRLDGERVGERGFQIDLRLPNTN